MEFLSGELCFFDPVIEIENDERIGFFETHPIPKGDFRFINIDLGWGRKWVVCSKSCYLVWIKGNGLRWEKIDFEENDENPYKIKDLKLLPYLKSKSLKCRYRKSNEHDGVYFSECFDSIISKNGYLQRLENGSVRLNERDPYSYVMHKTCVNYERGHLVIDGKEVKRWGFNDDMWECKSMISWVKKSFRHEQRLSIEEFMSLADKWSKEAMGKLERYVSPVFVEFYDGSRFEEITPCAKKFLKENIKIIIFGEPKEKRKKIKEIKEEDKWEEDWDEEENY